MDLRIGHLTFSTPAATPSRASAPTGFSQVELARLRDDVVTSFDVAFPKRFNAGVHGAALEVGVEQSGQMSRSRSPQSGEGGRSTIAHCTMEFPYVPE